MDEGDLDVLRQLVVRNLPTAPPDSQVDPNTDLRDLGLDSLAMVDLLLQVESTFGVVIPDQILGGNSFATLKGIGAVLTDLKVDRQDG